MNDIMANALSYFVVAVLIFIFSCIQTEWLLMKKLMVKASPKKILIGMRLLNSKRFMTGTLTPEGDIKCKPSFWKKDILLITPRSEDIGSLVGAKYIEIDKEGKIYRPDGSVVSGFDPIHIGDYLNRLSEMPPDDEGTKKAMLILMIGCLLLAIANVYLSFKNSQKLDGVNANFESLKQIMVNSTVHTIG